jgi:hypothetical protein
MVDSILWFFFLNVWFSTFVMQIFHIVKVNSIIFPTHFTIFNWWILSLQAVFKVSSFHSHSTLGQKFEIFLNPIVEQDSGMNKLKMCQWLWSQKKSYFTILSPKLSRQWGLAQRYQKAESINYWHLRVWTCHGVVLWYLWCWCDLHNVLPESHRQGWVRWARLHWLWPMIQNLVVPYLPCELLGTLLYYEAWDFMNMFFWLLQEHQPFESIPPLMLKNVTDTWIWQAFI